MILALFFLFAADFFMQNKNGSPKSSRLCVRVSVLMQGGCNEMPVFELQAAADRFFRNTESVDAEN